jgi:nitrite reductase/ring-hydroxylating ferredoxin subunit
VSDPDIVAEADRLIAALGAHPDLAVRGQVERLLTCIDAVHRTGLERLVALIHAMAGDAFLHRLASDPAVRLLLMAYDLVPVDRRLLAEEALDTVRGALGARGLDVELVEVVGGAVTVRLHGGLDPASVEVARGELEAALRAGLPGFQQLTLGDRPAARSSPLLGIEPPRARAAFRTVAPADAVAPGTAVPLEVDGEPVLIVNVEGRLHAMADRCGESPLPLRLGTLEGPVLRCPWHGCRWDVRTGERLDGGPGRARVFPVRIADGEIQVALCPAR